MEKFIHQLPRDTQAAMLGLYVHPPHPALMQILAIRVSRKSDASAQGPIHKRAQDKISLPGGEPFTNCIHRDGAVLLRRRAKCARFSLQRLQPEVPEGLRVGSSELTNFDGHC